MQSTCKTSELGLTALIAFGLAITAPASIIDSWDFTYPDSTPLSGALSNNGTALGGDSAYVSVQGNALEFSSDNADGTGNKSSFRTTNLSVDPIAAGLVEVSWTVTSASMANTDAADGSGRLGFSLRDTDPTADDLGFARLLYHGGANEFRLQYTDDVSANATAATFAGNTLADFDIRFQLDLDNAGSPGSFQLWYTEGGSGEIHAVTDGIVPAGGQVDEMRTVQQITNGGTDWRAGDTIIIDNLVVQVIPEPASLSLMAFAGFTLVAWRRRFALA